MKCADTHEICKQFELSKAKNRQFLVGADLRVGPHVASKVRRMLAESAYARCASFGGIFILDLNF